MSTSELWRIVQRNDSSSIRLAAGRRGTDVNSVDEEGCSLLHVAADCELMSGRSYESTIDALLEAGVNPNLCNDQGETFLLRIVTACSAQRVLKYLRAGANPNLADESGNTPLLACLQGVPEPDVTVIEAMLEFGADIDQVGSEGKSARQLAEEMAEVTGDHSVLRLIQRYAVSPD
jgi:ankyrin repeat protein